MRHFTLLIPLGLFCASSAIASNSDRDAMESKKSENSVCPEVSFAEVFADPDNLDLNYCYLRQKLERGELKSALPVVERILLLEPHQEQARVLYASLLYHNDMMSDAKREFTDIDRVRLPQSNQNLVIDYLRRIDELDKRLNQSIDITFGGHFDDNRNAAPEGDTILFYGFEFPFKIEKVDDYGTQVSVRYDIAYKFGEYRNHRVLGSLEYARDNQAFFDEQDFASLNTSTGARFDLGGADLTALGFYSFHRLSGSSFLRSVGSQLNLSHSWHLREQKLTYRAVASSGWFSDTYINSDASNSAEASSGDRTNVRLYGSVTFDTHQQLSLGINYGTKDTDKANTPEYAYDSWSAALGHLWLFGAGHSVSTYVSGGRLSYLGTSESITGDTSKVRLDTPVRVSVTLTTPVAWFVNFVSYGFRERQVKTTSDIAALKNFTFSLSGEYLSNHSNIPNYDYDNVRWQALFSKRFEF
ncbi:MAG: hypothetical protein P1U57_02795 [Oleibacter sp.]|nr:hypothetical protein [Thalassolituus sp.]